MILHPHKECVDVKFVIKAFNSVDDAPPDVVLINTRLVKVHEKPG